MRIMNQDNAIKQEIPHFDEEEFSIDGNNDFLNVPKFRENQVEDSPMREVNFRKTGRKTSIGYWKKKFRLWFKSANCYLINMELNSGYHTTFIVAESGGAFNFNGKKYTFDDDLKYLHVGTKMYCYDFHEGFALPVLRKIDLNNINKAVAGSGITEIEYMTNPSTLERFVVSKIAEGIMKGQQLDAFFRQIRMLVIICVLEITLLLIMFVLKTGMLKSIKIPGIT